MTHSSRQLPARDILPGMTIRYAGAWFRVRTIAVAAGSQSLLSGSDHYYLADVIGGDGSSSRLLLHGDDYGYRVLTYSAT